MLMEHIELLLDEDTVKRARKLAADRGCTLEQLIADLLKQAEFSLLTRDLYLGMFADEPELLDRVVESAMQAREDHPLRAASSDSVATWPGLSNGQSCALSAYSELRLCAEAGELAKLIKVLK